VDRTGDVRQDGVWQAGKGTVRLGMVQHGLEVYDKGRDNMECKCLFCGDIVTPEEGYDSFRSKDGVYYIFQCNNIYCDARYESFGLKIPRIDVQARPRVLEEYLEGFP
jgi:hypothetical protein